MTPLESALHKNVDSHDHRNKYRKEKKKEICTSNIGWIRTKNTDIHL